MSETQQTETQESPRNGGQGAGDDAPDLPVIDDFDALVDLVIGHEQVFVRYSRGPQTDGPKSMDYEAEVELPGLSVTNLTPEPWWSRPTAHWVARRVCKYADLSDGRPDQRPWVLLGRVVGNGPDHEPLVVDVKALGWIGQKAVQEAQERYQRVFKAGRGSDDADKENEGSEH
ncbi:DUF6098 family protein [Actinocrinis sp.]|uniref:DUF6098 family protein n=1 Tax=Actinocrinis sp. TaxID=1920516 RepID=UPI002BCA30CC|nr:DUF6098 family protein [Actinocrinis sp.]HXR71660.1 DUF6098 family protein [Actinocrinis sp.]